MEKSLLQMKNTVSLFVFYGTIFRLRSGDLKKLRKEEDLKKSKTGEDFCFMVKNYLPFV